MTLATLRLAAEAALARRAAEPAGAGLSGVTRVTFDVVDGDEHELVSCKLRGEQLTCSCTCGERDCRHSGVALAALAGFDDAHASAHGALEKPDGGTRRARTSEPPGRLQEATSGPRGWAELAEALEDVVTAVVRTGLFEAPSPSVLDSLDRLGQSLPAPLPLGLGRWIGRMRLALVGRDADGVARLLDGAVRMLDDLRTERRSEDEQSRVMSWVGAERSERGASRQLHDRVMIELGRELLDGVSRGAIERRYLLDLVSGRLYREERAINVGQASLGTCPRIVFVGLAEVERGAEPERVRLLQYVSSPTIPRQRWTEVCGWAGRSFETLVKRYGDALASHPATAEPVALIAADSVSGDGSLTWVDDTGGRLPTYTPLGCEEDYLSQRLDGLSVKFVLGRLVTIDDILHLRPIACGFASDNGDFLHVRV